MSGSPTVDDARRANARREILHAALRSRDVSAAARAAARARLEGLGLDAREAEHASAARRRFGRALRDARARRNALEQLPIAAGMPPEPVRHRRIVPSIAIVAFAGLFLSDVAQFAPVATARVIPGCDRAMQAPLGAQRDEDVPMAPPPEYYGPAFVGPDGSGVAPIVDPYRTGPIAPGFVRLIGRVIDDASGLPIEDACLIYTYGIVRFPAGTDAAGIFVTDLPAGKLPVELRFEHASHAPVLVRLQPWGEGQVRFFLNVRMASR